MSEQYLSDSLKSLPFSKERQQALLGHLIEDDKFFSFCRYRIEDSWWESVQCSKVWSALLFESNKINRKPNKSELKSSSFFNGMSQSDKNSLYDLINKCTTLSLEHGLDTLTPELTDWMHARIFVEKVNQSSTLFNVSKDARDSIEKRKQAFEVLKDMTKQIDEITFDHGSEVSFDDFEEDCKNLETEYSNALSFGVSALDRLLLPEADGRGSMLRGDTTILVASTNVGKTTAMITIACHNIKAGKNVLFISHEGRPEDIKLKIRQCMVGVTKQELLRMRKMPENKPAFEEMRMLLKKRLLYLPLNKAGLTIEEVSTTIQRYLDKFYHRTGEKIDLIIDDYLAILNTKQNSKGNLQKRQADEAVYKYGVQIALEHNCHLLTAIQTNREGYRVNNRKKDREDRLLTMEDVAESFGPMMSATNVITINRDPIARARNRLTFFICKSRSSEVDWAVVCKSNYPCCVTHSESLGATWYRGTSTMSERIDQLLNEHRGQCIPDELVLKKDHD